VVEDGYLVVTGDRITAVAAAGSHPEVEPLPAPSGTIMPGLVDIHCHGGGGASFPSGDPAEIETAATHHLGQGTTSLVASTVTDSPERMLAAVSATADAVDRGLVVAIHLEGPFLSQARCGAQDPRHLRAPDLGLACELIEAGRGHVQVMTLAPELPGSGALVELLHSRGVIVAVGHTEADAMTVERVLSAEQGLVTHLFNGMPALHHRAPGPVGGSLSAAAQGRARVELVADGVHLADTTVSMLFHLIGPGSIALVTDAMAAAGMPDGDYVLGPQRVTVTGSVARLQQGSEGSIAGGTARLLDVVRRCVQDAGIGLFDAVTAASRTPAAVLGIGHEVGSLRPGLRADLVVVDDELRPLRVMRSGGWVS
jgi:N-acetylglucosamine-6-phosphate deacetylase